MGRVDRFAHLWVTKISSTATTRDFLLAGPTARMARGPLVSLSRLPSDRPDSAFAATGLRRCGHRGRRAPPRGGRAATSAGASGPAASGPDGSRRSQPAALTGKGWSLLCAARNLAALAPGPGAEEMDLSPITGPTDDSSRKRPSSWSAWPGRTRPCGWSVSSVSGLPTKPHLPRSAAVITPRLSTLTSSILHIVVGATTDGVTRPLSASTGDPMPFRQ